MDVEGDLLAGRAPVLVAKAVHVFAVVLGIEGVVAVGGGFLEDLVLTDWVRDLIRRASCQQLNRHPARIRQQDRSTYPEVNLQISCAAKLPVPDLEGHGHLVILVEGLVEALPAVGRQLDVVCYCRSEQPSCQEQRRG